MGFGQYCHFGLRKAVAQMAHSFSGVSHNIELLINIDGLALSKSSKACLWPILCSNTEMNKVYLVGAYFGETKPETSTEFLYQFIDELIDLINNGQNISNNVSVKVRMLALICDAPAKAFVLCTKSHTGFSSWSKCIEGNRYNNRICFPPSENVDVPLRTDAEF